LKQNAQEHQRENPDEDKSIHFDNDLAIEKEIALGLLNSQTTDCIAKFENSSVSMGEIEFLR
jgi:hypothetical protein